MRLIKYNFLFIFIILTFSAKTFAQKKKIKHEEYITEYYYKTDSSTKPYKKKKYLNKYLIFDERNNLIEECEYGERFAVTKIRDSIVMISHYNDFLKKNRIPINKYDSLNRIILEETCRYKNNIKSKVYSKYQYLYDDVYNKITRIDIDNDTIFYSSIKKQIHFTILMVKNLD